MGVHDEWWERHSSSPELQRMALRNLVGGLPALGNTPIPYGTLPQRAHTAYGKHFRDWAQLSGESISSLMEYPMAGTATVRALLAAARAAVLVATSAAEDGERDPASAVARLLDRLDERDRAVLAARTWTLDPEPQRDLASRLGVSNTWFGRREPRINAAFADLLTDPAHRDVLTHAAALRRQIGPYAPEGAAEEALRERGLHLDGPPGTVLLFVAGPYTRSGGWLEDSATGGAAAVNRVVEDAFGRAVAPTTQQLVADLTAIGMPAHLARAHLERTPEVRRFGERWVRWGEALPEKIRAVLQLLDTPTTAPAINAAIDQGYLERSVREALSTDPRFHRHTRQSWALREWALPEYGGIVTEIGNRIDAAGGRVAVEEVVADVVLAFPDVTESSVRSYAYTSAFVAEAGVLRRRTAADPWSTPPPIRFARGVFVDGPAVLRVAIPVTSELRRGSGQRISPAAAAHLGMTPGDQRTYGTPRGDVHVDWRIGQTGGPRVGSLRALAEHVGAVLGDELLLVIDGQDRTMDALRIDAGADPARRLRLLLGTCTIGDPLAAMARGMRCPPADVAEALARRGEQALLAWATTG